MKYIGETNEIKKVLKNKFVNCKSAQIYTAWFNFNLENFVSEYESKIEKMVVGLSFYMTSYSFIEKYNLSENIRFYPNMRGKGVFHPKIYFFDMGNNEWSVIIGSHNFTGGAFYKNKEFSVLFDSGDFDKKESGIQLKKFKSIVEKYWSDSKQKLSDKELADYKVHFEKNKMYNKDLGVVSENIDASIECGVATLRDFEKAFKKNQSFGDIDYEMRKKIAGGHRKMVFGGTNIPYSGSFSSMIDDKFIVKAIDSIPLVGEVTRKDFDNYKNCYNEAFDSQKNPPKKSISSFSRLLAMKRPDLFLCLNNKNKNCFKCVGKPRNTYNKLKDDFSEYWSFIEELKMSNEVRNCKYPKKYKIALLDFKFREDID